MSREDDKKCPRPGLKGKAEGRGTYRQLKGEVKKRTFPGRMKA